MESPLSEQAWLECLGGELKPLGESFVIGRSAECQAVIKDPKVSRRHCMINRQGTRQCWLVDLQSANGTRLNGRRVAQATRLCDGDRIELAGYQFRFHQPSTEATTGNRHSPTVTMTIQDIRRKHCWLLVGDLVGSTGAMRKMAPEEAASLTGEWLAQCRKIVDSHGGVVNKYLGDGFFAYWLDEPGIEPRIAEALKTLQVLESQSGQPFRLVLHFGSSLFGGAPSLGEESMAGADVNFTFRMEDLASRLGVRALLSEAAAHKLNIPSSALLEGTHCLQGFEGDYKFYTV